MNDLIAQMDLMLAAAQANGEHPTEWAVSHRAASVLDARADQAGTLDPRMRSYGGLPVVIDPGVVGVSLRNAPTHDGSIERERGATMLGPDSVATYMG